MFYRNNFADLTYLVTEVIPDCLTAAYLSLEHILQPPPGTYYVILVDWVQCQQKKRHSRKGNPWYFVKYSNLHSDLVNLWNNLTLSTAAYFSLSGGYLPPLHGEKNVRLVILYMLRNQIKVSGLSFYSWRQLKVWLKTWWKLLILWNSVFV